MNVALTGADLRASLPMPPGRGGRPWTFLVFVVLPTLLVLGYLTLFAASEYSTEFRFSVIRLASQEAQATAAQSVRSDPSSLSPAVESDRIVVDYLKSHQVIDDLRRRFNLAAMFHSRVSDPLLGFWWDNGTPERMLRYWRNFVLDADFDSNTDLGSVGVRAYTPQDALRLSQALVELTETLVNEISLRARKDAVKFAEQSQTRAQKQLDDLTSQVASFRNGQRTASVDRSADAQIALASQLRTNLSGLNAQLDSLHGRLSASAPSMVSLRSQVAAAESELSHVEATLGHVDSSGAAAPAWAQIVTDSKFLDDQLNFALTFRNATMLRLEQARYDAEVQHDYLQVHVRPALPQAPSGPAPLVTTFVVFTALSAIWATGMLIYFAMRDHGG